jgi:hypothetical protein
MDGPCSVICGDSDYAVIILPDGSTGGSGIVVDPAADENSNNSVNKIQLNDGVPSEFILSIIVDNCHMQHSAINTIKARGEHLGEPVEADVSPSPGLDAFNGVPDLYRFKFSGFVAGDFIKIKLNGQAGEVKMGGGASLGGFLVDLT